MKQRMLAATLVAAQFALIAALALTPRGSLWPAETGVVVVAVLLGVAGVGIALAGLLGLGSALTPSPIPRQGGTLVTSGIYGVVRHPIYTGIVVAASALALIGASWWHLALFVALVVLLEAKARWEERMLLSRYPEYRDYSARVGRFLPGIGKIDRGS